jgi:hypothetical protein
MSPSAAAGDLVRVRVPQKPQRGDITPAQGNALGSSPTLDPSPVGARQHPRPPRAGARTRIPGQPSHSVRRCRSVGPDNSLVRVA